jgi:hypothetical protein
MEGMMLFRSDLGACDMLRIVLEEYNLFLSFVTECNSRLSSVHLNSKIRLFNLFIIIFHNSLAAIQLRLSIDLPPTRGEARSV